MKAIWNGKTIADSDDLVNIEGNYYFPISSINKDYLKESSTNTHCFWKGESSYYSIEVDGKTNKDAAWYYKTPSEAAKAIKDRVAFWKGVEIVE